MSVSPEALSYPIGRHEPKSSYTADERNALIARLAAQPAALAVAITGFGDAEFARPYRPDGWTVQQLVHHIADSHLNMFIRVKFALSEPEPTIKPYDQDVWVQQADVHAVPPSVSLTLLGALHQRMVALFGALSDAECSRTLLHPENGRMTIADVLAMYAWHGDHHIAHIVNLRKRESL